VRDPGGGGRTTVGGKGGGVGGVGGVWDHAAQTKEMKLYKLQSIVYKSNISYRLQWGKKTESMSPRPLLWELGGSTTGGANRGGDVGGGVLPLKFL